MGTSISLTVHKVEYEIPWSSLKGAYPLAKSIIKLRGILVYLSHYVLCIVLHNHIFITICPSHFQTEQYTPKLSLYSITPTQPFGVSFQPIPLHVTDKPSTCRFSWVAPRRTILVDLHPSFRRVFPSSVSTITWGLWRFSRGLASGIVNVLHFSQNVLSHIVRTRKTFFEDVPVPPIPQKIASHHESIFPVPIRMYSITSGKVIRKPIH